MKIERTKNATRNVFFGVIYNIYIILIPFIIQTIMIYCLGIQYVGLNGLFTSVLKVLNLTELGVGTAMVYSMYKPIAEDDTNKICALMQLYRKYYRVIGIVIALIGILLIPVLPYLINGDLPDDINVYILYLLNLCSTAISYWLFAYKNALLLAHQRIDITNKISLCTNLIQYIIQIISIIFFYNYYLYLVSGILGQIITNFVTAIVTNKIYPEYKPKGQLRKSEVKDINQRVKDLFTTKFGGVIQGSFDSIIISAFLGLTVLGQYNNYYYIISAVFVFVSIIFNAVLAGIGNSIITETSDKNYSDFLKLFFIITWIIAICASCFTGLFQPFIMLWVGEKNMLSFSLVICLILYFVCITMNQLLCVYKDGAGIWHQDRYRPLVVAIINLLLNILTVRKLGLFGVVLSTVISMVVVGMPWLICNLFHIVFERKPKEFLIKLVKYLLVIFLVCIITYLITRAININGILSIGIKGIISVIIPNAIYIIFFYKSKEYQYTITLIKKIFRKT